MVDSQWPPDLSRKHDREDGRREAESGFKKFLEEIASTLRIAENHLHPGSPDPIAAGLNLSHAIGMINGKLVELRG